MTRSAQGGVSRRCEGAIKDTGAHLIVPASRGLKAYSQSFMSFSLMACRRIPRCFVHTAKVLGV